jgi:hypothetical protein
MSISAIGGTDLSGLFHQRRLDFKTLASAVQAGDLTAAQAALQSYQNDTTATDAALASGQANGAYEPPPAIKTDLSNLTSAVQAGNIADAQTALQAYAQDREAQFQPTAAAPSDTTSAVAKDLTGIIQAIQSGDTSGIQSGSDALTKDLQSLFSAFGPSGANGANGANGVQHHHHHHHHQAQASPAGDASQAPAVASPGDTTSNGNADAASPSAAQPGTANSQPATLDQVVAQFINSLEQLMGTSQQTSA